jgi:septal ring factor EnvC (AmiA/AmiB activator)
MGNILLIIAIVVSLLTAGVGFMNRSTLEETKGELSSTQGSLNSERESHAQTKQQLSESQENLAKTTQEKDSLTSQLASTKSDLDSANNKVASLESDVTQKQSEIERLNGEVSSKDQRIAELEQSQNEAVAGGPDPTEELQAALGEKEAIIEGLQTQLASTRNQLDQLRDRENARTQQRMRAGLTGKIMAVNPSWNFVVLDVGDRNGVVNNAEMLVKRGTSLIGKVRITSVEPSTSIADIVASSVPRGFSIQPGDSVIYMVED